MTTPQQRLAALKQKEAQLQARIKAQEAKIKGAQRRQDTRRKIVAGAIALEHMAHDAGFAKTMRQLIHKHVKDGDKNLFEL